MSILSSGGHRATLHPFQNRQRCRYTLWPPEGSDTHEYKLSWKPTIPGEKAPVCSSGLQLHGFCIHWIKAANKTIKLKTQREKREYNIFRNTIRWVLILSHRDVRVNTQKIQSPEYKLGCEKTMIQDEREKVESGFIYCQPDWWADGLQVQQVCFISRDPEEIQGTQQFFLWLWQTETKDKKVTDIDRRVKSWLPHRMTMKLAIQPKQT